MKRIYRPDYLKKRLSTIKTTVTLSFFSELKKLPMIQQLKKMQDLGTEAAYNLDGIEKICNAEIVYLLSNLKPSSVSSVITEYKRQLDNEGYKNHPYKMFFKLPHDLITKQKQEYREKVMKENTNLRPFSPHGYIDLSIKLMKSKKSYIKKMIGLCAITGRRPSEILLTAKFKMIDERHVLFSGQLKTKGSALSNDNYLIPVLSDSKLVIDSLQELRDKKDFSNIYVPPNKVISQVINAKTSKEQGVCIKKFYSNHWDSPKPYDLRSIYTLFALRNSPENITNQAYIASILGHSKNDSSTAASYLDFYMKKQ